MYATNLYACVHAQLMKMKTLRNIRVISTRFAENRVEDV